MQIKPLAHDAGMPPWLLTLLKIVGVAAACLLGVAALWAGQAHVAYVGLHRTTLVLPPKQPVVPALPLRPAAWPLLPGNRTHAATKLAILAHFSRDPSWAKDLPFPVEIYSSQARRRLPPDAHGERLAAAAPRRPAHAGTPPPRLPTARVREPGRHEGGACQRAWPRGASLLPRHPGPLGRHVRRDGALSGGAANGALCRGRGLPQCRLVCTLRRRTRAAALPPRLPRRPAHACRPDAMAFVHSHNQSWHTWLAGEESSSQYRLANLQWPLSQPYMPLSASPACARGLRLLAATVAARGCRDDAGQPH